MRTARRSMLALSLALAAGFTTLAPAPAHAETAAIEAVQADASIFREAASAARSLRALTLQVELSGAGGMATVVPTASGTVRLARDPQIAEGPAWYERIDTKNYKHTQNADEKEVSALRTPSVFTHIDHDKKAVQERPRNGGRGSIFVSAMDLLAIPEITSETPYNREINHATSYESLGQEEINGVACDVVMVRYDMTPPENGKNSATIIRTPAAKWYFGSNDRIPRRVERITDEGILSFTIILDIAKADPSAEIGIADLEIETPEGYSRSAAAGQTRPQSVPSPRAVPEEIDAMPTPPAGPADPVTATLPAHGFELVDADGNAVSLDGLKGNISVLYFWGTWCVPCRNFSPLVSDLVTTFEGEPVKVFGLPVRERNEQAVRDAMGKYKHTLLLNPSGKPIGCDETARAYKVRRYPTVYVVGPESEILAVKWPESGVTAEETMAQIEQTIRDALAAMN